MDEERLIVAASTFIDPADCDSTISYKIINGSQNHWGNVILTDCSDKIEWYFRGSDRERALAKIDKAIAVLGEFRQQFADVPVRPEPKKKKKVKRYRILE